MRHRRGPAGILPAQRIEPADLAAARDHHGRAGQGALVDLALEGVRHALQPDRRQSEQFRPGVGQGRRLRGGGCLAAVCAFMVSPVCSCCCGSEPGLAEVWRRTPGLNRAFDRFALAIGPSPMLETARIGGDCQVPAGV